MAKKKNTGAVIFPDGVPRGALPLIHVLTKGGKSRSLPRDDPMHLLCRRSEMEDKLEMTGSNLRHPRTCDVNIEAYYGLSIDRSMLPTVVQPVYGWAEPFGPSASRSMFRAKSKVIDWMYPGVDVAKYMRAIYFHAKGFYKLINEMAQGYKANHVLHSNIPQFIKLSYEWPVENDDCGRHTKHGADAEQFLHRMRNRTVAGQMTM